MSKPKVVLISDIHFSEKTLELASQALQAAINKAESLNVPLIICGDLHDTKAIIRGEVANRLIKILQDAKDKGVFVYILVGNHDVLNEKRPEHGLNYLKPYAWIVDHETYVRSLHATLFPYQANTDLLKARLKHIPSGEFGVTLIMHQGFLGAEMGEYIKDESSISPDLVKDFKVFSGHYHKHQQLQTVTYIGSPYTMSFAEANDPPKGFLILNEDGTFTREILRLRKHVIKEATYQALGEHLLAFGELWMNAGDLLWLKITGPQDELRKINKDDIGKWLPCGSNYKLDLIYTESAPLEIKTDTMSGEQILDALIENQTEYAEDLKKLWRGLV